MDDIRRRTLTESSSFLHNHLVLSPIFYDTALQYGVFPEQIKEILQEESPPVARSKLIEHLKKGSAEQYDAFLHIMKHKEVAQSHVAQQLEETEKLLKEKVNEDAQTRVEAFLQKQYYNNRVFTPMAIKLITDNFVLKEDLTMALVQTEIHMDNSRRLKTEALEKDDEIGGMKDLLFDKQREITKLESQLNQLKTTLHDQMKKYGALQKDYTRLRNDYTKDEIYSEESTFVKESGSHMNRADNKSDLQKVKNDFKRLNQKYEIQLSSIQKLNQSVVDLIDEETYIKGSTDPLKQLEKSIKYIREAISQGNTNSFRSIRATEHSEKEEYSTKMLQEKLNLVLKEKRSYREKLKITNHQLAEVRMKVEDMESMIASCGNSLTSGSRRCSVAFLEQMDSLPEKHSLRQSLPTYTTTGKTHAQFPMLPKRPRTVRNAAPQSSHPFRKSYDDKSSSVVSSIKQKEFKFQLSIPTSSMRRY